MHISMFLIIKFIIVIIKNVKEKDGKTPYDLAVNKMMKLIFR